MIFVNSKNNILIRGSMEEKESNIFIIVEPELKKRFKAKAALEGSNMTKVIESFIRQYVSEKRAEKVG